MSDLFLHMRAPFSMAGLMLNQRLKPAEIVKLGNKKLRSLVLHSYHHVPYYNSLFKQAGLKPDGIRNFDDFAKIPISKKKDLIDLPQEKKVADNIDVSKCWMLRSSGTTGTPITIFWEKKARMVVFLNQYLWQLNCGDRATNRQVVVGPGWVPDHPFQKIGIFRTKRISPSEDLSVQIEQIKRFNPETMLAYSSCVRMLAKEIKEGGVQGINISRVFTGGEMPDESSRRLAREAFGADVFDCYGANEVGGISWECREHVGYHVHSESILFEIIRDGEMLSPGEEGEVTVTNLNNYAMPVIRYNLEDLGMLLKDECPCGRSYPLMKVTQGRKINLVQLPNGKVISSLAIIGNLTHIEGIRQFQVVQERIDRFLVRVVKDVRFGERTLQEIKEKLTVTLGEIEIEVQVVDNIPREKSGKFKQFAAVVPPNGRT